MTTVKDVQRAQVLIERCMLTYMPFEEVQTKLHHESDVEPALTQVVWRKLQVAQLSTSGLSPAHQSWPRVCQEANPRFFEHYLLRVRLKEQMVAFASLLAPSDGLAVNPLQAPRDEAP